MAGLSSDEKAQVSTLLVYPPDTAGGIMSDRFLCLRTGQTVDESLQLLQGKAEESEGGISYLYVTNDAGRLVGIVSMRDLVFRGRQRTMGEIMSPEVDRKSTRLNSSHSQISYAVFC